MSLITAKNNNYKYEKTGKIKLKSVTIIPITFDIYHAVIMAQP